MLNYFHISAMFESHVISLVSKTMASFRAALAEFESHVISLVSKTLINLIIK